MPRPRPPFPAQSGYRGKPTTINNVETFANIPPIILNGREWYAAIGTEGSKGTKIFALAGKVNNTGLVEVPMGTTLRQIVFDIGGGIPGGKRLQGRADGRALRRLRAGRATSTCRSTTIRVKQVGAIMGSGGLIVLDENTCMVDIARFFLDFTQNESCGKCVPCRIGTRRMLEILEPHHRGPRASRGTSTSWSGWPRPSRPPRCAAWGRRRRTRCSPRSATSATSTTPTSASSAARPELQGAADLQH